MINRINLFDFQQDGITYLLDKTTDKNAKTKIILKSPTGSGKTVMLLSYVEDYLNEVDRDMVFIWLTPGAGNLEEQSEEKMRELIPNAKTGDVHDILLQGFHGGTTYFINWEMITNKRNVSLRDSEKKNLFERIADAHRNGLEFIVIVDEEHRNDTSRANDILNALNPLREIRVSATTTKNPTGEFYEIPEEEVINSGLITRALLINEDIEVEKMEDLETESLYLIQKADEKRQDIKQSYDDLGERVNPLVIIQFPDMSDTLIKYVEECLETMGYSYKNGLVSIWMSDDKINTEGLTENDSEVSFLLMKQAISTGWDCPRAKILVKLRENMTETFEIQTLGRIRRMPQAKHYHDDRLDYCFLYTFDEKYKETVMQSGNSYEIKRVFRKEKVANFKLIKEVRNRDFQKVNEREVRDIAYDFFTEKYSLTDDKKDNIFKLENYGFVFGTQVFNTYRSGKFRQLKEISDKNIGEQKELAYEINTHQHGLDCLHAVDMIKKVVGLPSNKTRAVLQNLFHKMIVPNSKKKLLALSNREWYAFMINNARKLRDDFIEISAKSSYVDQLEILQVKKEDFYLPKEDFYPYLPYKSDVVVYENNAYEDYNSSMVVSEFRSISELLFENHLESRDDIDWYYKNGDTGQQYLSILYITGFNKEYLFYPDYIIKKKNGEVWIIETKGGEYQGKSKNIDKQIENKFNAFKEYTKEQNINWGFIRDKDTNLYINNTDYSEDMSEKSWIRLTEVF